MCFTPEISFATFAIEILLGIWILKKNPKKTLNQIGAVILFLLGVYQLTEFMLCTSGNPLLWGKWAHLVYTFLPALSLHWVYTLMRKKINLSLIYSLPIAFSILTIATVNFVKSATCDRYFITVFYELSQLWFYSYVFYYGIFMIIALVVLIKALVNEKNKNQRNIYAWGLVGFLAVTAPVYVLVLLFPVLNISFPSILCEFALLFGIAVVYTTHLVEKKH